jgi:hypothetical protein
MSGNGEWIEPVVTGYQEYGYEEPRDDSGWTPAIID